MQICLYETSVVKTSLFLNAFMYKKYVKHIDPVPFAFKFMQNYSTPEFTAWLDVITDRGVENSGQHDMDHEHLSSIGFTVFQNVNYPAYICSTKEQSRRRVPLEINQLCKDYFTVNKSARYTSDDRAHFMTWACV